MSTVFIKEKGEEKKIMEDVISIESKDDGILVRDIMGEEKKIKGRIDFVDLIRHRIILIED